ncbi:MAG: hypothetical protein WCK63_16345, partial [Betaproteobacteria bacterium]
MTRMIGRWTLGFLLLPGVLQAADGSFLQGLGAQGGLVFPASPDLRTTAGSLGYALGAHGTWVLKGRHSVRPRLDLTWLPSASQASSGAGSSQAMTTKVSSRAVGVDYLYGWNDRCSLGFGFAETRWAVASTHTLTVVPGSPVTQSGTSAWTRLTLGPVVTYRITP